MVKSNRACRRALLQAGGRQTLRFVSQKTVWVVLLGSVSSACLPGLCQDLRLSHLYLCSQREEAQATHHSNTGAKDTVDKHSSGHRH